MKWALSSSSFLCNEEIISISSNLITQFFFLPSAVKVARTSPVPFKLIYQLKVDIPIKSCIRSWGYQIHKLIYDIMTYFATAKINKRIQCRYDTV